MQEITWFNAFRLVRFSTMGEGDCLIHAILGCFSQYYIDASTKEKRNIARTIRQALSLKMEEHYKEEYKEFAEIVPEFSQENMEYTLASSSWLGYGYLEIICNELEKDLIILSEESNSVYVTDEEIIKQRPTVIIHYNGSHFESVGLVGSDKTIHTHFLPEHFLVKDLIRASSRDK